jgi:hypothetical protein
MLGRRISNERMKRRTAGWELEEDEPWRKAKEQPETGGRRK